MYAVHMRSLDVILSSISKGDKVDAIILPLASEAVHVLFSTGLAAMLPSCAYTTASSSGPLPCYAHDPSVPGGNNAANLGS